MSYEEKYNKFVEEGIQLFKDRDFKGAKNKFESALLLSTLNPTIYQNIAVTCIEMGDIKEAINNLLKLVEKTPENIQAVVKLGDLYLQITDYKNALKYYELGLKLNPAQPMVLLNLAILKSSDDPNIAIEYLKKSLKMDPNNFLTHFNLANHYQRTHKEDKCLKHYRKAIKLNPNFYPAYGRYHETLIQTCNWSEAKKIEKLLDRMNRESINKGVEPPESPLSHISRTHDPDANYLLTRAWGYSIERSITNIFKKREHVIPRTKTEKLKIGYLSSDFRNHAIGHLMFGLFSKHDKNKFEIYAFSTSPDDKSWYYKFIKDHADRFVDLVGVSADDAATIIKDLGIHILVDINGHTSGDRLTTLALKPAPIQVNYLGYPGSTGTTFMDYIIADPIIIPEDQRKYYSEAVAYLPNCYQVNSAQPVSTKKFDRKKLGLPENAFVFASFNQPFKIEPGTFSAWTKILKEVPGSVLWLLNYNRLANSNIKKHAKEAGIDPKRIVFGEFLPKKDHLSRMVHADLVLDTFIYGGHTSTSDALWMSLPVVTLRGDSFPSLVASSILANLGMQELITDTPEEYVNLAVKIAKDKKYLSELKKKIIKNKRTFPLFNTEQFARDIEHLYQEMWKKYLKGEMPRTITPSLNIEPGLIDKAQEEYGKGNLERAKEYLKQAIKDKADNYVAIYYLGMIEHELGDDKKAEKCFRKVMAVSPHFPDVFVNLGNIVKDSGDVGEAEQLFNEAIKIDPNFPIPYNNLGLIYRERGEYKDAIRMFGKAVEINPKFAEAYNNLGACYWDLGDNDKLMKYCGLAIEYGGERFAEPYKNIGAVLLAKDETEKALEYLETSKKISPENSKINNDLLLTYSELCDWDKQDKLLSELNLESINPFVASIYIDNPKINFEITKKWAQGYEKRVNPNSVRIDHDKPAAKKKLKIGYISADFSDHPVGWIIRGLFRAHDRKKVETYVYSFGNKSKKDLTVINEVKKTADHFLDINDMSFDSAAGKIKSDGIDILIDLMGFTEGHRAQIISRRPAPVIIQYLGFMGTMGLSFYDYVIADEVIAPLEHDKYYSEKIIRIPCYQVNTPTKVNFENIKRQKYGLPKNGKILLAFNRPSKVSRQMFSLWMDILGKYEDSYLWLWGRNNTSIENIKRQAKNCGINEERIIFAEKIPWKENIKRMSVADIALDTYPYNGGATSSSILYSGVPIVTLQGNTYSSRMTSSLLSEIGLKETITESPDEYKRTVLELLNDEAKLKQLKTKLVKERTRKKGLYDIKYFAEQLEKVYFQVWENKIQGKRKNITIK